MSKSNLIKAVRYEFQVGKRDISGYLMPDSSYRLSKSDACNLLGCDKRRLSQLLEKKVALALMPQGLTVVRAATKSSAIDTISFSDFCTLAVVALTSGYEDAIAFAGASILEVMESRMDQAVGLERTIQERNERFQIRFDGILSRHFWTDSISEYIKTHPDLSENYKRWVFHNVSDTVNLALFGLTAKKVREHYQLENGMSVREVLGSRTLKLIDTIENAAATRVLETDSEPKQAIKDVIHLLGIEPSQDRL